MKFINGFILICLLANCGSNIERNKIVLVNKKTEYPITLDLDKGFDSDDKFTTLSASYLRPVLIETENYIFIQYCTWGGQCDYKPEGLYSNKINSIKTGVYIKITDQFYLLGENNSTSSTPLFVPYFTDGHNHIISYIETFKALEFDSNQTQNNKLLMAA